MKTKTFSWFRFLFPALLAAVFALGGCLDDGDDGATGPKGDTGDQGIQGEPGTATLDAQTLFDLGLADSIVALNPQLDLSQTVEYDAATEALTVHFFLRDGTADNNIVDVFSDRYEFRFYVAELVDDGTPDKSWNGIINREDGYPADPDDQLPGTLTQDDETGKYTYVFAGTVPASDNVIRVTVRARWREDVYDQDGNRHRIVFANPVNASYDFYQADPGAELPSSGADMVSTEACESCHGARIGNVGHGGGYTEVKTCNNCHNVNYMAGINTNEGDLSYIVDGDLAFMIHRIHSAYHDDTGRGISTGTFNRLRDNDDPPRPPVDFSHVRYPQEIYTCSKCHTEEAPDAAQHTLVPTRANCGSCHEDVNFATAENHNPANPNFPPPQFDDNFCNVCHTPGLIAAVHDPDSNPNLTKPENIPEYDVQITMSDPGDGRTYYIAGETPVVTVELFDPDTGVEVAGTVYTADQDGQGVEGDQTEGLSVADLFVYGPRANAVPVLTTDSTTDGGNDQGRSLFLVEGAPPVDDPQVATNTDGYKYQLMDNIGDLQPGTYMVRFEGENYGSVANDDYRTPSTAVITFQVEQALEEPKVSGDACVNCHGDTAMHVEGQYAHNQPFDTDGCLACHDVSGNYADYIGNRVHAIHSASITGDLYEYTFGPNIGKRRNWSHITFPRPANNCRTCHTNPATEDTGFVPVWRDPNEVACGGCHGAEPMPVLALYTPEFDPADIVEEVAAATHMQVMGGNFDVTSTNPDSPGYVVRQCIVCHGEGRIADLFETHGLVNFPFDDTASDE